MPLPGGEVRPLAALHIAIAGFLASAALATGITFGMKALGYPGGLLASVVVSELALWSGLIAVCVFASRTRGRGSLLTDFNLRIRWSDLGWGVLGSLAARSLAGVGSYVPISLPHRATPDRTLLAQLRPSPATWFVLAIVLCVGAPVVEELFFRGLMQPRLVERLGVGVGVLATSVLFGAAHLIAWQGKGTVVLAAAVAGAGLGFGFLRQLTGRVGTSIAAHALFNAQALVLVLLVR